MALKAVADGLFAHKHGSDPTRVVALHGWGRSGADFDAALAGLDGLAIDLPGFGASPPPSAPTGARGYARLVVGAIEQIDRPPVLVGHSFGGRVAVCLAGIVPVAGLVLTGVPLLRATAPSSPAFSYRMLRWAQGRGLISEQRLEAARRRRGSADYLAAQGVMRQVLVATVNETYEDELEALDVPVAMVWGARDGEVPVSVAERARAILERRRSDVELKVIADVGHLLPVEAPESLRQSIDEMLTR